MIFRFKLTYSGADTTVIEPKGWSDFKSEIKRDFKAHGVIFKYTSGTLKLGFADGRSVLETAFRNDGYDAIVTLTVDQRDSVLDAWVNAFTGNAVMKNRELDEDYFNVDFETSTFQQKVINRIDTKVRLDTLIDLDGNSLSGAITSYSGSWNDIRLKVKYRADFREGGSDALKNTFSKSHITTNGTPVYSFLVENFEGEIENNLKAFQTITPAFSTGQISDNSGAHNFIISSENTGDITITGTFKYRFHGTLSTNSVENIPINLRWYLRREDSSGTGITQTLCFNKTITTDGTSPYVYDSGIITASFDEITITGFLKTERLFLYLEVRANVTEGGSITTTNATNVDIYDNSRAVFTALKAADTNTVKHYLTHDIVERVIYILTGADARLKSGFFGLTDHGYGSDGCGGLTAITNGRHLRGINDPPEISLKEILDSLSAIYGTGYSFENDGSGNYSLRLELMEFFYTDNEIIDLGNPVIKEGSSYKETTFDELTFNSVVVGYNKFANDEDFNGDIDDFLTMSEYSLPINTIKGQYNKTSRLITSGRLIQATYEARADLTKSWKYDSDNFFVCVVRSASTFIPENDENFQTLAGFANSASDTAYNLRVAPVYMMLNHALIVNSALFGKVVSEIIINTSAEINKSFSALFNSSEDCLLGDVQRLERTSIGNITIENNFASLRLFAPIQHELTVAMTKAQLDLIIDNMENNGSDNYGYLTYRDNEGAVQTGYPLVITWNPNDEIAAIKTLEKADNYGI